jgi:hypothetical protein
MDFVEEYKITSTAKSNPGVYDYYEGLTLNDLFVPVAWLCLKKGGSVEYNV